MLEDFRKRLYRTDSSFETVPHSTLAERLALLLSGAGEALKRAQMIGDGNTPASPAKFAFHVDVAAAVHNGTRAFFALLAAAAFWVESAWSSGGSLVVIVAIVTGLFSSRPNGVAAGIGFIKGAVAALAAAAICNFLLLPGVSGFPALTAITAPFLVLGGIAMRLPAFAAPAASFTLFFWDIIGPDNATRPDFTTFANSGLTLMIGIACGTLMFALLFPSRPLKTEKRLYLAVARDLRTIGTNPARWSRQEWLMRSADRINRLATANLAASPDARDRALRTMFAISIIGDAAIALSDESRHDGPATAKTIRAVLRRVGGDRPDRLAAQALRTARRLAHLGADGTMPAARRRRLLQAVIHCEDIVHAATRLIHLTGTGGGGP